MSVIRRVKLPGIFCFIAALSLFFYSGLWAKTLRESEVQTFHAVQVQESPDHRLTVSKLDVLLEQLPEYFPYNQWREQRIFSLALIRELRDCLQTDTCAKNQDKVVLLGSYHFPEAVSGANAGEDIWARSTIDALESLGYTYILAYETLETLLIYQAIPDLVKMEILETYEINECMSHGVVQRLPDGTVALPPGEDGLYIDEQGNRYTKEKYRLLTGFKSQPEGNVGCIKKREYPEGIPIWKIFAWHWWPNSEHPLHSAWTLAPEDYGSHGPLYPGYDNTYLGYSIEKYCTHYRVDHSEKVHRGFIFAKKASYFSKDENVFYREGQGIFDALKSKFHNKFDFVSVVGNKDTKLPDKGVHNLGKLPQEEFYHELGTSKVLIGLGNPFLSPTPYDALCLGVPFISPVHEFEKSDREDKTKWQTQHNGLIHEGPPYVYHVHGHDFAELQNAIIAATETPIDPYIPRKMKAENVMERLDTLINADWKGKAQAIMHRKLSEGHDQVAFTI